MAHITCKVKVSLLIVTGILWYYREGGGSQIVRLGSESVLRARVRLCTQPASTVYSDVLHWWPTKLKGGKFKRTRLNLIKFSQSSKSMLHSIDLLEEYVRKYFYYSPSANGP